MTSAPDAVTNLIERFDNQLDAYRSGRYKETTLRRDFIDPLFEALGWDINNTAGYAEAYRDVIHEDAIKMGGVRKAPSIARSGVFGFRLDFSLGRMLRYGRRR